MPVPGEAQKLVSEANGGFVSIVVLPRHVKDATLDDFVWTLLSFHDHIQYHVKCFKVSSVDTCMPFFVIWVSADKTLAWYWLLG